MAGVAIVPAGEDGGIYDMQERMNVALPSDEEAANSAVDDLGAGQAGNGAAMEHGFGAPIGVPPGQSTGSSRLVWDRTEEGRREIENLGEVLAERVIGQEAAVDMVATTMQMCYVGLHASSGEIRFQQ